RRQRRTVDNGLLDWIVVRNRLSPLGSRNQRNMIACLYELSMQLGFRIADGISERVIFREFFPMGLTAFDDVRELDTQSRTTSSHLSARQEVRKLIGSLRLPVDDVGRRRAEARAFWLESENKPMQMPDIFAD
ncbi:MAG: division plane positioning ATPase MipZ, partial [Pseudomonadota bacterium]